MDKEHDTDKREKVQATLRKVTDSLYVYVDDAWWGAASRGSQAELLAAAGGLSSRLETEIRPRLALLFGRENVPGADGDERLTLLIHELEGNLGAYVRTQDAYSVFEASGSNEREMMYFSPARVVDARAPSFLAHEYMHLITLNQRELGMGITDDVWLQEAFSEIAPTIVGYGTDNGTGYLDQRVRDFIRDPRNSLPEWWGLSQDYGAVSMFVHYLHSVYGERFIRDAFWARKPGMEAFDVALDLAGASKSFGDVFEEWVVALFLNDCSYGSQYCYIQDTLRDMRVTPYTNFLPLVGESELTITNQSKAWAGNWHKISGGAGELTVEFQGSSQASFRVPYVLEKGSEGYEIGKIPLSSSGTGTVRVENFGSEVSSFILMPIAEGEKSGFQGGQPHFSFTWTSSVRDPEAERAEQARITELLEIIEDLKRQIAEIKAELAGQGGSGSCGGFERNLGVGDAGSGDVRCLQEFLVSQGRDIYPEGLVTGNYFSLTSRAVARFQERYAGDILAPLGLREGTGYFGPKTRAKANELLGRN